MATKNAKRDVIALTDDDFKAKVFKTAPGGTYSFKISSKSKIVPGKSGNQIQLVLTVIKGPHKGVNVFDRLMPHVGWKIAQLLLALNLGKKKALTLQELLKLVVGKELRVVIRETKWEGRKKNEVVQYLPLVADGAEDDDEENEDEDVEDAEDSDDEDDADDEDSDDEEDEEEAEEEEEDESDDEDDEETSDDDEEEEEEEDSDEDEDDEDEDEEEEEEEEEEEPAPKKRGAKTAPAPAKKAEAKAAKAAPAKAATKRGARKR